MFKLVYPLPNKYYVACSGGIDSMAALHFLDKPSRNGLLGVVHVDHGTEYAKVARKFLERHCKENNIDLLTHTVDSHPPNGESKENWWREKRYEFFHSVPGDEHIILAHQLDDCVEEYLMCVLVRGFRSTIPYQHGRCIRPFRLWKREEIQKYSERHDVKYIEDPSNKDTRFKRNMIRHEIMPHALKLNPGLYNIVQRIIENE